MQDTDSRVDFDSFLKNFRKHVSSMKLKNSIQKDYVLKALFFAQGHLNAEEIALKIKKEYNIDIGIATVYRALKFFESINLITTLDVGDAAKKYELDLFVHHDHLICTKCHKIVEFTDEFIEDSQKKIAKKYEFNMNNHSMVIYGICEDCQ